MTSIGLVYYSMYGNTHALAVELALGIEAAGVTASLRRVPELLPDSIVAGNAAVQDAQRNQAEVLEAQVDELPTFDGVLFGSPTRFGNRAAQLSNFLDQTGGLWSTGALSGKAAGFFTGASTIHGGHESTILTMATFAFHHGMVIVPMGYGTAPEVQTTRTGGGPYGATHWSPQGVDKGTDGLAAEEIAIARAYGRRFAELTVRLAA